MILVLYALLLAQSPPLDRYVNAQKAFAANPKSQDQLVALVSILFENDQNQQAIGLLESFLKTSPRADRAKLFLALGYVREEKYDKARVLAAQVAAILPGDYYAQHILGLSFFGLNEFSAAEERFKKSVFLKPDFADAYFQLGLVYSRDPQKLQQALSAYQKALAIGYPHEEIYRNLATVNVKLGKYDEAIRCLNQALEMNPAYADAYFQLADVLRKSGQVDAAAEATRKFQELNAEALEKKQRDMKGQADYEQGVSLLQKDDLPGAYKAFKTAAEILPQLDAASYRMAQIEYLGDRTADALADIHHAIELNPFEAEYYFVLARCLEDSDVPKSIEAISTAISLNGGVADFHSLLADLYDKAGDHVRAAQSRHRAAELQPKKKAPAGPARPVLR